MCRTTAWPTQLLQGRGQCHAVVHDIIATFGAYGAGLGTHQVQPPLPGHRRRLVIGTFQPARRSVLGAGAMPPPPGQQN